MRPHNFYLVNGITLFRLIAAPLILAFVFTDQPVIFGYLLGACFFTDVIDGYLARKLGVASVFGAKLDSLADDLTFAAAILGAVVFKLDFLFDHIRIIGPLVGIYFLQLLLALLRYHRVSSFHTYLAKIATLLTGSFFILLFITEKPSYLLFYAATFASTLDLLEEIILVFMLPTWRPNVKGIYWILKES